MENMDRLPATPELLTTAEVATILGVTTVRVHQLEKLGGLSSIKNQFGWRLFNREEVLAFAEARLLKKERSVKAAREALRRPE